MTWLYRDFASSQVLGPALVEAIVMHLISGGATRVEFIERRLSGVRRLDVVLRRMRLAGLITWTGHGSGGRYTVSGRPQRHGFMGMGEGAGI